MKNLITKTTELGRYIISSYISPGDIAVDATCGNGKDTLYLCQLVGSQGKVYAFDIQEEALNNTRQLLTEAGLMDNCHYIQDSHHFMDRHIEDRDKGKISAILFNLGYLPKGNKEVTTKSDTTLVAIEKSLALIRPNGIIAIVAYSGHKEGSEEKQAILEMAQGLCKKQYHAAYINLLNQPENPPELILITKK
ncbi:MAG: class I SAM-dependent methyltransferase [Anaerovoracaceae bacterium]|jgi:16S rRNA C1402 N4-methylase RsmH